LPLISENGEKIFRRVLVLVFLRREIVRRSTFAQVIPKLWPSCSSDFFQ